MNALAGSCRMDSTGFDLSRRLAADAFMLCISERSMIGNQSRLLTSINSSQRRFASLTRIVVKVVFAQALR